MDIRQLKRQRLLLGLTQQALAKQAGVSQSLIAKIEAGTIDPKYSTVLALSATLEQLSQHNKLTLQHLMRRPIITAAANDKVPSVIKRMQGASISQVPVLEGQHVVGLISERTIIDYLAKGKDVYAAHAGDIMEDAPPILSPTTPLSLVTKLLEHVPIVLVRENQQLIGVISRSDVIKGAL